MKPPPSVQASSGSSAGPPSGAGAAAAAMDAEDSAALGGEELGSQYKEYERAAIIAGQESLHGPDASEEGLALAPRAVPARPSPPRAAAVAPAVRLTEEERMLAGALGGEEELRRLKLQAEALERARLEDAWAEGPSLGGSQSTRGKAVSFQKGAEAGDRSLGALQQDAGQ